MLHIPSAEEEPHTLPINKPPNGSLKKWEDGTAKLLDYTQIILGKTLLTICINRIAESEYGINSQSMDDQGKIHREYTRCITHALIHISRYETNFKHYRTPTKQLYKGVQSVSLLHKQN
jgi:hypothetical protein